MPKKTTDLEKHLSKQGYKLTETRKSILAALNKFNTRWVTAQQLFEIVAPKCKKINISTVYRNLELLTGKGILCKIKKSKGTSFYILNRENTHHHHLICKSCGKTCKISFCPLRAMDQDEFQDFNVEEHRFEIFGYCKNCHEKK